MIIPTRDFVKITQYIANKKKFSVTSGNAGILKRKISSAQKVIYTKVPSDIIVMNSIIEIKNENNNINFSIKLVYPEEENIKKKRISIFSSLGSAIYLQRIGETIKFSTWKKENIIKILKISFQPEQNSCFF